MSEELRQFLCAQLVCGHDAARLASFAAKIVLVVPLPLVDGSTFEAWLWLDKARAVSFLEKLPSLARVWARSASEMGPLFLRQEPERAVDRG